MSARYYKDPDVVIVAAKRSSFGKIHGRHADKTALDLARLASQACFDSSSLDKARVDHCVVGNVLVSGDNHAYLPRHLSLSLKLNQNCPSYLVNRLCGSGMQAAVEAFSLIKTAKAKCVLAVGVESMSQASGLLLGYKNGKKLGHHKLIDSVAAVLHDQWIDMPMGQTAEQLVKQYKISKNQCDAYVQQSHEKYFNAWNDGFYKHEMVEVDGCYEKDEFYRVSDLESMGQLKPIFSKDGVHSAASSIGLADGASAIVLMDRYEADLHGIEYQCLMKDYSVVGCAPQTMGLGPVIAIRNLLNQQELSMRDISLFDINEAFAGQVLAVKQELGIPKQRLNVHGGSLAMGHPLGASANRNVVTLSHALTVHNKNYGIAAACIGGGQGIALMLQYLNSKK